MASPIQSGRKRSSVDSFLQHRRVVRRGRFGAGEAWAFLGDGHSFVCVEPFGERVLERG